MNLPQIFTTFHPSGSHVLMIKVPKLTIDLKLSWFLYFKNKRVDFILSSEHSLKVLAERTFWVRVAELTWISHKSWLLMKSIPYCVLADSPWLPALTQSRIGLNIRSILESIFLSSVLVLEVANLTEPVFTTVRFLEFKKMGRPIPLWGGMEVASY